MPGEMAPPPNAGQIRILGEPFVVEALASLIRGTSELQVLDQSKQIANQRDAGVRRYLVVRFRDWAAEARQRPHEPDGLMV